MNIVIVGQGAIGLLFYNFANNSIDSAIDNSIDSGQNHFDSVTLKPSYTVDNKQSDKQAHYHFTDLNGLTKKLTLNYANDQAIKAADIILFTVKSYQVKQAISDIYDLISPRAVIVLCHNGMGTVEELPKALINSHPFITMLTTHGCLKVAALSITHTGLGQIDFGVAKQTPNPSKVAPNIISTLEQLLTPAIFHANISKKQWLKLAINCVINPLTALYDVENGAINNKEYQKISKEVLAEIVLVAKAQDITLELNELIDTVKTVAQLTSKNSSSMRCDIANNKNTEIDYINGYIHRLGVKCNIATPANSHLWQQVSELLTSN